jgi:hypothetical protein
MTNTYRATTKAAEAVYGEGTFERDFNPWEEKTALDSGLIEIVPRVYRVVGDSRVFETATGETFEAGLPVEAEAALITGGHIRRVEDEAPKKTPKKGKEE